jgi:small-conductance mechanosensitive channel
LGVVYQTPADKLQKIPGMVREIVERQTGARFERCHLKSFGSSSLDYEVVYFVTSGDYTEYMDIQQAINLAIFRAFQAAGIAFAYPTQTLYAPQFEGAR